MHHVVEAIALPFLNPEMKTPKLATEGSAGLDIQANIAEPLLLKAGETVLVPSGFKIHIGNPAFAGLLFPRSGLGHKHGIVLGNLTGIIDSDYQGELKVSLWNRGASDYIVQPGERIAQLLLMPVVQPVLQLVSAFSASTRGEGGFGSSGRV